MATSFHQVKNRAITTTVDAIDNSTDPVTFTLTDGSVFPATASGHFNVTINNEIMHCTDLTGNEMTCVRAQESTTIFAHDVGATIQLNVTAKTITDLNTAVNALEGGIAGNLDDTAGGTDALVTKAITSNEHHDHNAAVLSTTIHNNNNWCALLCQTAIVDIPPFTTIHMVPSLTVVSDPASGSKNGDWRGTTGARVQSDAGSSATHIIDADAAFTQDMFYHYIVTSSDVGGAANIGYYIITAVAAGDLTIAKASGTNCAASYYYYLKYQGWTVPVTGLYLIQASTDFYPGEAGKAYNIYIYQTDGTSAPTKIGEWQNLPGAAAEIPTPFTMLYTLTAGQVLSLGGTHTGTAGTPDLYAANNTIYLKAFLLKQTA